MIRAAAAALLALGAAVPALAGTDCLADRVAAFQSGYADPNTSFRYGELPGILLGPPGGSLPQQGSTSTPALGYGGSVTLEFTDNVIVDGAGPDFIVFENAFFKTTIPADPNAPCFVFAEPLMVEVSDDGIGWTAFPFDPAALAQVGQDQTPCSAIPLLQGLAGLTPTFSGNWTVADDPFVWDPSGIGGISGAGGDAFDLADVGLASARFVRLTDMDLGTGFAGPAEGADLDSVVALHSIPAFPISPDGDGDGIPDAEELIVHGTDPSLVDSDGDGTGDGEEIASCRDPMGAPIDPYFVYETDLHFAPGSQDSLRWNFLSATGTFDLIRGDLLSVPPDSDPVDLAAVVCIDENSFNLTSSDNPDPALPSPGNGFFYLIRPSGGGYGHASDGRPRSAGPGDCLP